MKHLKKVLVSTIISASLCSSNAGAISTAGWVGIGGTGLLAVGAISTFIGCACSGKSNEKLLYAADPNQPQATDEEKHKILIDFLNKYAKYDKSTDKVEYDEKVKDKVVQTTVDGELSVVNVLEILGTVSWFLSHDENWKKVSMDGFSYGLTFNYQLYGGYGIFISDNCKFIKVYGFGDGLQSHIVRCVTFKVG